MDPWRYVAIALGGLVVLWRLYRGAHAWIDVGAMWAAVAAVALAVAPPKDEEDALVYVLTAGGWAGWYAFEWKRNAPAPEYEPPPDAAALRDLPAPQLRRLERIQAALMLFTVAAAIVVPIVWIVREGFSVPEMLVIVALYVGVLLAAGYMTYRLIPRSPNPFDRAGTSYASWLIGLVAHVVRTLARRYPLIRSRGEGRH